MWVFSDDFLEIFCVKNAYEDGERNYHKGKDYGKQGVDHVSCGVEFGIAG